MRTVGAFEAKTHFSHLLDQVENGKEITITRHGQAVAVLVPTKKSGQDKTWRDLVRQLRKIRQGQDRGRKPGTSLKELIEAGRR